MSYLRHTDIAKLTSLPKNTVNQAWMLKRIEIEPEKTSASKP